MKVPGSSCRWQAACLWEGVTTDAVCLLLTVTRAYHEYPCYIPCNFGDTCLGTYAASVLLPAVLWPLPQPAQVAAGYVCADLPSRQFKLWVELTMGN